MIYLSQAGDALDEDKEDDGPADEETAGQLPADLSHVIYAISDTQYLVTDIR